jgi:hypothetical protein
MFKIVHNTFTGPKVQLWLIFEDPLGNFLKSFLVHICSNHRGDQYVANVVVSSDKIGCGAAQIGCGVAQQGAA